MKVLLIQPNYTKSYKYSPKEAITFPPLGLESIAANILDIADVKIFDLRLYNIEKLKNILYNFNPYLVGISCNFSSQIYHVNAIAKIVKETGSTVVVGGWHPTIVPDQTLKSRWIDIVVRSEGEITFRELLLKGTPVGIKGLSYKDKNGNIIHNSEREFCNLDQLKPPARYLRNKYEKNSYNFLGMLIDCLETSRGCPFNCKFCTIHTFFRRTYRIKSIQRILNELYEIKKNTRLAYIIDDNFMIYPQHVSKLCDSIIKEKLNMFFMTTARIDFVHKYPYIFEKMAKAGFMLLFIGIESFSHKTLKKLNKNYRFKEIKESIKKLHDLGFVIQGSIIIGANLDDTPKDIETTIEIAKMLEIDVPTFSLLTPYPTTELWNECKEKNLILSENWKDYNWYTPLIKYKNLTPEDLNYYLDKAYSEARFFQNPIKKIINIYHSRGGLKFFIPRLINKSTFNMSKSFIKNIILALKRKMK